MRQFHNGVNNTPTTVRSPPTPYQMPPSPYPVQVPMQNPTSFQLSSVPSPVYHPQPSEVFYPTTVPFSSLTSQPYFSQQYQQQELLQQRTTSPALIHYMPSNPTPLTFVPQTQQRPLFPTHNVNHMPPQFVEQMNICSVSETNGNQMRPNLISQLSTNDEVK